MRKLLVIIAISFSCNSNRISTEINFELIIENAKSYKIDFIQGVYTVYFINKPPEEIKFLLSGDEKNGIQEKYYELSLNKLPSEIKIPGTCMIMPQIYTTVYIKNENTLQKIQIENGCDEFSFFESRKAKRIKTFINYIYQILNLRPEIKNSPKSDVEYI